MNSSLFSIAIPTKNRHFLLTDTIRSVLDQSYSHIEVVICDNSDNDATYNVFSSFRDSRLRYHKTGGLTMHENWEAAFNKTMGEFVTILEDKQLLRYEAVERILKYFINKDVDIVTWHVNAFNDLSKIKRVSSSKTKYKTGIYSCDEVIRIALSSGSNLWKHYLPIAHHTAVRRELSNKVISLSNTQFDPICPDYTSAFKWLNYGNKIACLSDALSVFATLRQSNGRNVMLKNKDGDNFFKESKKSQDDTFNNIPIKARNIAGLIYNDFLSIQKCGVGNLSHHKINLVILYSDFYNSMINQKNMGVDISGELFEWKKALSNETQKIQNEVFSLINNFSLRNRFVLLKNIFKKIKSYMRKYILRKKEYNFITPIDYILHEKQKYQALSKIKNYK